MVIEPVDEAVLKDRAIRLFDFLIRVQQVRSKPHRTLDGYEARGGRVILLGSLPKSPAIRGSFQEPTPEPDRPYLILDRVPRTPPPAPQEVLAPWLAIGWEDDPNQAPVLSEEISVLTDQDDYSPTIMYLENNRNIERMFESWVAQWKSWALEEEEADRIRSIYTSVFQMSERVADAPEELELLLGVGTLSWRPDGHEEVCRPIVVLRVSIDFDDSNGRLTVRESDASRGPNLEFDMLEPGLWPEPLKRTQLTEELLAVEDNLLSSESMGSILRRAAHNLGSEAQYSSSNLPAPARSDPNVSFAPTLILRKRSNESLIRVFNEIRTQLESASCPPRGIAELVAVLPSTVDDGTDADVPPDENHETYLPLHANKEQARIVERVSTRPHVVVQGPPGTGKTHTIANLVSHLLAQGKKVLVTAQTDRALRELRAKLPASLEALCVSAVGRDQSDLTDLKVAVNELASRAEDFDALRERERIVKLESALDKFRRQAAETKSRLIERRETEVVPYELGPYFGTLSEIARAHRKDMERFGWLEDLSPSLTQEAAPLANEAAAELYELLTDRNLDDPSAGELLEIGVLPNPEEFHRQCVKLAAVERGVQSEIGWREHPSYSSISKLAPMQRAELSVGIQALAREAARLASRGEPWMSQAIRDISHGKPEVWKRRREEIRRLLVETRPLIDQLGVTPRIEIAGAREDVANLVAQAEELGRHLQEGGKLKRVLGSPRVVKQAQSMLAIVTVDGRRPETVQLLERFVLWARADRALEDIEMLWPADVPIPDEDTLSERWAWHFGEVELLSRVTVLAEKLQEMEEVLSNSGIPQPDWFDPRSIQRIAEAFSAAETMDSLVQAQDPIAGVAAEVGRALRWPNPDPVHQRLAGAVRSLDSASFREAYTQLHRLHEIDVSTKRRDDLVRTLLAFVPKFPAESMRDDPSLWRGRMELFEEAWTWCEVGGWIDEVATTTETKKLQAYAERLEMKILGTLADLTAAKAWEKSVSRLGPGERQSLKGYALAVKRLGKGTGKYAQHKRKEAQHALQNCRDAVPAWVMPIYRIAETLSVSSDIFDVVIIDEASQAGLDAAFLQYLAPKVVVVGDDKQVSPAGVGIDNQLLIDLRKQYLCDFPQGHLWEAPQTSFFDLANIMYGDVITLREHFRCVPEIIGFSNRIAYEPEGVSLIPLRQYGTDRLEPIKTVYVDDGYAQGVSGNRINQPEADAIVAAVLKCLSDPAYDGKTMGVISLTGRAQAARIEKELLSRIDLREYRTRELRCGDAPDFQGSERDVIFLSLVATRDANFAALTSDLYLQRFNVAASRAKDQMWLFHSVLPADIANRNDLRLKLLEYCRSEEALADDPSAQDLVATSDGERDDRFDSLFEQHVYNDLCRRRFNVVPQWEVYGYRIDLVVVGGRRRLAIECDGDQWHGAKEYESDLNRQRELERCGWIFFRLPASTYYRHPAQALEPLWDLLDKFDIRPTGWKPSQPTKVPLAPVAGLIDDDRHTTAREPDVANATRSLAESQLPQVFQELPDPTSATEVPYFVEKEDEWLDPEGLLHWERDSATESSASAPNPKIPAPQLGGLAPYVHWDVDRILPSPTSASTTDRINGLVEIVRLEGPVQAERVFTLFVKSAGMAKVGKSIKTALNVALTAALRGGVIVSENSLNEAGNVPLTLRLPDQPKVNPRSIGPRNFHEVPPSEVAALIASIRAEYPYDEAEEVCRKVLATYGLKKVTTKTWERFRQCDRIKGET